VAAWLALGESGVALLPSTPPPDGMPPICARPTAGSSAHQWPRRGAHQAMPRSGTRSSR
jgi:hypothetical protein